MYYEVFIDVIFTENLIADFTAIHLTQQLLYKRKRYLRSILGAIVGAVVATIRGMQLWNVKYRFLAVLIYMAGYGIAMLISFSRIRQMMIQICFVHLFLMMIGANTFVMQRVLEWHGRKLTFVYFTICILFIHVLGTQGIRGYQRWNAERKKKLYSVWLYFDDKPVIAKALLDTGNLLQEPQSGKPVSIIESRICREKGNIPIEDKSYSCIPFHSVGKEDGILHAIHIPVLKIQTEGSVIEKKDVVVAFYQGQLSVDHSFQMILHPALLK